MKEGLLCLSLCLFSFSFHTVSMTNSWVSRPDLFSKSHSYVKECSSTDKNRREKTYTWIKPLCNINNDFWNIMSLIKLMWKMGLIFRAAVKFITNKFIIVHAHLPCFSRYDIFHFINSSKSFWTGCQCLASLPSNTMFT